MILCIKMINQILLIPQTQNPSWDIQRSIGDGAVSQRTRDLRLHCIDAKGPRFVELVDMFDCPI